MQRLLQHVGFVPTTDMHGGPRIPRNVVSLFFTRTERAAQPWRRLLTGKTVLLLRGRPTGPPVHEGLHLLLRHLAILVAVHRLENPFMRRLKFLQ